MQREEGGEEASERKEGERRVRSRGGESAKEARARRPEMSKLAAATRRATWTDAQPATQHQSHSSRHMRGTTRVMQVEGRDSDGDATTGKRKGPKRRGGQTGQTEQHAALASSLLLQGLASSSGMLGGAVLACAELVGVDEVPEEKKDDKLRRGVEAVDVGDAADESGGDPSGGKSNGSARGDVGDRAPGAAPPLAGADDDDEGAACADSLRRNSIHRFENDCGGAVIRA